MSATTDLIAKYERLLKDPYWPQSNRAARRAIRQLLRFAGEKA